MAISQKNRPVRVSSPLGEDVLLFYRMHGTEKLGELFEYELELLSESAAIDPDKMLGENVTVGISLPDGKCRHFNGYVARFGQYETIDGFAVYRATLRPWLWFLTRAANCRIFQHKAVPDVVKQVFRDHGFSDFKEMLGGHYAVLEYCVQYRESDFDFVSRLMEGEGIYYYFTHDNGKHHLVLADSASAHGKFPGYENIPYHHEQGVTDKTRTDHIHEWTLMRQVQPGAHVLTDYDFKKSKADLLVKSVIKMPHAHAGYERFDYPGRYVEIDDGEHLVRSRMEERRASHEACEGQCNARGLGAGYSFKLTGHHRDSQNREYLVVSVRYSIKLDSYIASANPVSEAELFKCSFTATDATQTYRPSRNTPKALVQGPQTAVVVGPAGEEIHTDQYGRVKVQFHWDRYGKRDENSSCWVRVSQPWAGKNWGIMAIPRIGQEVVVDFLEGDPDRPLITGSVYNNSQMPPYKLPDNAHLSTTKSNSTKGGGGFNEIRFDDKKGKEQIFIHAEKNQDVRVKSNSYEWVGNDRHLIVKTDQLEEVGGNLHATVKGNQNEKVGGTVSLKAGMDMQQKIGMKLGVDAGQEIHLKAGMNVVIEAGMSITLKAGGGFIVVGPAGVTISGTPVLINSGGSAGSGSGASPEGPKLPKAAANDNAGGKDAPPPPKPPKPGNYGPSATALKMAANNGKAFCKKCAAANK
ncbi:MAG: type VI secretion system tip protein VgrG [Candidatus Methylumidiphilus alinenensis]|uniref:Type VI secretion system tip protein VgrG n=1 Tax=Candidatus Methylumidiphilus alinenensis TaxID=2202197 RepID=A0A2W4RM93_9GAMM|nr:MAG: type VI secretion system tip protein VgrG [Candidatus Methylumidiphilus alinenensis]